MIIFAETARLADGWAKNTRVTIKNGRIAQATPDALPVAGDIRVSTLLPAPGNLHSHTFQRAMAGMTEHRQAGKDSFWTWRDLMYRFLERLTPDQFEAIAALAFMEMQEAGYASVGEFHYVHHRPGGGTYDTLNELSQRIYAAADQTGIGLTHLPVLYTFGGVGQRPLEGGQLRFGNDPDRFSRLVQDCRTGLAALPDDANLGIAPHSLRATCPADLARTLADHPHGPVHIHIAEQPREVSEISSQYGARPVEWLLQNADVNTRWCLIHATHMTDAETRAMAATGAVAGLCPITEANLGDGPFNGPTYLEAGGRFGVGSDSNINISLIGELRMLEYSQRLRDVARNVMVNGAGSVGEALYLGATAGGAQALGRDAGQIRVGALADLVAIDRSDDTLFALPDEQLLDGFTFAASDRAVTDLWSAGHHMVQGGRHVARDAISATYQKAITQLVAEL